MDEQETEQAPRSSTVALVRGAGGVQDARLPSRGQIAVELVREGGRIVQVGGQIAPAGGLRDHR